MLSVIRRTTIYYENFLQNQIIDRDSHQKRRKILLRQLLNEINSMIIPNSYNILINNKSSAIPYLPQQMKISVKI